MMARYDRRDVGDRERENERDSKEEGAKGVESGKERDSEDKGTKGRESEVHGDEAQVVGGMGGKLPGYTFSKVSVLLNLG